MDRNLRVNIDHMGIISKDLDISGDIFLALGFVTGGKAQLSSGLSGEKAPINMHFLMDNTYLECIQSNPGDYLEEHLNSPAALHIIILNTGSAEESYRRLQEAGFHVTAPSRASRFANHGERKGQASFLWFNVLDTIIPHTKQGIMEHLTRELIYQPNRYQHDNTAYQIEQLIVCCDPERAELMEAGLGRVMETIAPFHHDTGIHILRMMGLQDIQDTYGVTPNPERSPNVGLTFLVRTLAPLMERLEHLPYAFHRVPEGIVVDVTQQINLFMLFKERP